MASYAFLDRLNKLNEEVYEELAEIHEAAVPEAADSSDEEGLTPDMLASRDMRTIRQDVLDVDRTYSGKRHLVNAFSACDRCGWARGNAPAAYQVKENGVTVVKIVCLACFSYFNSSHHKGSERPEKYFGLNAEAIKFKERQAKRYARGIGLDDNANFGNSSRGREAVNVKEAKEEKEEKEE